MALTLRRAASAAVFVLVLFLLWHQYGAQGRDSMNPLYGDRSKDQSGRWPPTPGQAKPPGAKYSRILVVPKLQSEHTGWIEKELPGVEAAIYEVDDLSNSRYKVPKNKGHEAMVYLTYIIDHYDSLPDTIIFAHAHRTAWHNNILLDLSTPLTIKRLRDDRVARQGYMNLRCHLDPGCPNWIHIDRPEVDFDMIKKPEERHFNFELFQSLFPGERTPPVFSQPCCAQFAVSAQRVQENPKATYEHLRNWLLATDLDDKDSGRIFEYLWQYLFTRNAEHCPAMNSCYCDGFGICFGSASKLDDWLQKLKDKEAADDELDAARKAGKEQEELDKIAARKWKLHVELENEKAEAYKRGDQEENRAMERERASKHY